MDLFSHPSMCNLGMLIQNVLSWYSATGITSVIWWFKLHYIFLKLGALVELTELRSIVMYSYFPIISLEAIALLFELASKEI